MKDPAVLFYFQDFLVGTAEILTIPGLKRDMTTTEMMLFVDAIKEYALEFLNYRIPDPEQQTEIFGEDLQS